MALSYGEIRVWKASDAGRLADGMVDRLAAFEAYEESLREAGQWNRWINSEGATTALIFITTFRAQITDAAAEAQALRNTAEQVESALSHLNEDVISVETFAEANLFSIGHTGNVVDLLAGVTLSPAEKAIRASQELQIRQTVSEITIKGQQIETVATDGLRNVLLNNVDDGGARSVDEAAESQNQTPPPPEQDAPAVESRVWWDSLSPAQQQQMIRERPDDIRNLWGLPSEVRDPLNREALDQDISTAQQEVDELRDELDQYMARGSGSDAWYAGLAAAQSRLNTAKRDLSTLENTLTAATGQDRMLLEYDLSEELPEVAIAIGDPDTADNVSMTVGGYTTNVHDSVIGKADDALSLHNAASLLARGEDHATIAFLGYQHPQKTDVLGVGTNSLAFEESTKVENAIRGIAMTNDAPDVNVSLFGHSYGSTTSGIAAQNLAADGQSPIDNLALYGSPGIPEVDPEPGTVRDFLFEPFVDEHIMRDVPDTDALGIDDGRAFHMTAEGDFVTETIGEVGASQFGLGNPPRQWQLEELSMETTDVVVQTHADTGEPVAHDSRFGRDDYNRINGEDVGAHSIYTKEDTISLHNLAAIAADRLDLVVR